jgi:hypothetical protein
MGFRVFWQSPQRILCVELAGNLSLDDLDRVNAAVNHHFGDPLANQRLALLIDVSQLHQIPQNFAELKASQTYAMRRDLKYIVVVGSNKFMRLMMMLTFNLSVASLRFFDTTDQALRFIDMAIPALSR